LVEQILASHRSVEGVGERRDIAEIGIERLPALLGDGAVYPACLRCLTAEQCRDVAGKYLAAQRARAPKARCIVDKMPFNFLHLGLIALLFPKARIVHCRRDARDVALSCYVTNFADNHPWSTRLADIAAYMTGYRRLMAFWKTVLPIEILDIDYERLVADQKTESRRLIDHRGLRWDPACLDFHETRRAVSTAARPQVRQPLYTGAVGRWRDYARWLAPYSAELGGRPDGG
ncbi:MAG: sulfotransferase, partial [Rhodospirillaceae bacterium]